MKVYEGIRHPNEPDAAGDCVVFAGDQILLLEPSLKVRDHSPTGFSWGYGGSGPAQLALAILLDHFGSVRKAEQLYQSFKRKVVVNWPQESGWKITSDEIDAVCREIEQELAR